MVLPPIRREGEAPPPEAVGALVDYGGSELDHFYAALVSLRAEPATGRVVVVELGDSHTAGEGFTGHLPSVAVW